MENKALSKDVDGGACKRQIHIQNVFVPVKTNLFPPHDGREPM